MKRMSGYGIAITAALSGLFAVMPAFGQYTPGYPYQPAPIYTPQPVPQVAGYAYALTPAQMDQLLAPVALYPDPLLADILPATTYPEQLNEVAISLRANPNIDDNYINAQPWPDAVKVLAHYPALITFMTSRPDWTTALGAAFTEQPGDVMDSIQRLRGEALAAGTLYTTPQQQVIASGGLIQIVPAQAGVVYVPQYDPTVVYVAGRAPHDALRFGGGWRIGPWLNFDFDWGHHDIGVGARWDHGHPDHDRDFHDWHRDDHVAPPPHLPPAVINRFNNDARRGFVPPPAQHPVFDTHENRADVQRADRRAREVHPGPVIVPHGAPARPGAAPRPSGTPGQRGGPGDRGGFGDRGNDRGR
jgi:hypothetical protein